MVIESVAVVDGPTLFVPTAPTAETKVGLPPPPPPDPPPSTIQVPVDPLQAKKANPAPPLAYVAPEVTVVASVTVAVGQG